MELGEDVHSAYRFNLLNKPCSPKQCWIAENKSKWLWKGIKLNKLFSLLILTNKIDSIIQTNESVVTKLG